MAHVIGERCTGCTICARICPVAAASGVKGSLHSIDPERCFDCGACGRSCPAGAIADEDGVPVPRLARKAWPRPVFALEACISCRACVRACPISCLEMSAPTRPGGAGALPALARPEACVSCGYCETVCPAACVSLVSEER